MVTCFFFFLTWSGFKHSHYRWIFVAIHCQFHFKCHLRVTYQSQESIFILFTFIDFEMGMGTLLWKKVPSAKSCKHLLVILMSSLIIKFVDVIQYKELGFTKQKLLLTLVFFCDCLDFGGLLPSDQSDIFLEPEGVWSLPSTRSPLLQVVVVANLSRLCSHWPDSLRTNGQLQIMITCYTSRK